jgi:hypothetical protein
MTEIEFLEYCKKQVSGSFTDEDIITMLTAWGSIKYSEGYSKGLEDDPATATGVPLN